MYDNDPTAETTIGGKIKVLEEFGEWHRNAADEYLSRTAVAAIVTVLLAGVLLVHRAMAGQLLSDGGVRLVVVLAALAAVATILLFTLASRHIVRMRQCVADRRGLQLLQSVRHCPRESLRLSLQAPVALSGLSFLGQLTVSFRMVV